MIKVLNIPLYDKGIHAAVKEMISIIESSFLKKNFCVSATGAHGLVTAMSDGDFRVILENFWCNLPDGMPGVWVGRIKGASEMDRCYGPDLLQYLMQETSGKKIKHYFCGGKENIAEELKIVSSVLFQNENVVGCFSPPFKGMSDAELEELAKDINSLDTDIVWIGLSTPKQEIFASRLAQFTDVHFLITVGAAFDFYTGKVKQAPKIFQRIGLEWFFRLMMEPKRLYKRYFEIVPLFIYHNFRELFLYLLNKQK